MSLVRVMCCLFVFSLGCGNDGPGPVIGDGSPTSDASQRLDGAQYGDGAQLEDGAQADGTRPRDASVDGPAQGELGGPCFPNKTCFDGLRCESDLCIAAADAGPAVDSNVQADALSPDTLSPDTLSPDTLSPDTLSPDVLCVPNCASAACGGDDGCGNACQTGACLAPQDVCLLGVCTCQPSCNNKVCGGPDGCGGSCDYGSCAQPNTVCNGGRCDCAYASCGSLCCGIGEYCLDGACTPGIMPGWKSVTSPTQQSLEGVWGSAWNDVWAVGDGGTVVHWNGSQWGPHNSSTTQDLLAVSGSSSTNVWAVSNSTIIRYDGSTWSTVSYPDSEDEFRDVYVADGVTFVAGNNGAYYTSSRHPVVAIWDGSWTRYEQTSSSGYLVSVGGSSATDVWAQGWLSQLHYNGAWQEVSSSSSSFTYWHGVFGVANDDIWVAGWNNGDCRLFHYQGSTWDPITCPTSQGLFDAHGTGATDIWAVGSNGAIIHYDGNGWALSGVGVTSKALRGVWAASPVDAWAVGDTGTILRYSR